jgi:hypothetical protein
MIPAAGDMIPAAGVLHLSIASLRRDARRDGTADRAAAGEAVPTPGPVKKAPARIGRNGDPRRA